VQIEPGAEGLHWLLIRRSRRTGELAWYRCWSPRHAPLATFVRVAGLRRTTQENFQAGKGLAGLDEHQVRTWTAWHRWVTLAMLALAFLTIAAITGLGQDRLSPSATRRSSRVDTTRDDQLVAVPYPAPTRQITIYGWSTSRRSLSLSLSARGPITASGRLPGGEVNLPAGIGVHRLVGTAAVMEPACC
jgi:hypothetical protein